MFAKMNRGENLNAWLAVLSILATGLALGVCACGGSSGGVAPPPTSSNAPQTYFAGAVWGAYQGSAISDSEYLSTYSVDTAKKTFSQSFYTFGSGNQKGVQLDYSGSATAFGRGLSELAISYSNALYGSSVNNGSGITYNPPLLGNWIFELPQQAGGFVNLTGMPFVPIVPAQQCPGTSQQTYLFVSIPAYIGANQAGFTGGIQNWDPDIDTAYGTVGISGSGNKVSFSGIQQFTSSGSKVTSYMDVPGNPAAVSSASGACSSTFYGNTSGVPTQVTITNPGPGETISSTAIIGIGPSGLLVENNGQTSNLVSNAGLTGYEPFLGSGTGAMGLPQPSGAVDTKSLTGAQYMGVIYGGGTGSNDWTSLIGSFGFPSQPGGCPTGSFVNPLFGGDFPANNPRQTPSGAPSGYGNCDVVIDLGAEDASNHGLFRNAIVYLGPGFQGTSNSPAHSFPVTAIAGQLGGKQAVFAIGVDTNGNRLQAWGIYLFQSN